MPEMFKQSGALCLTTESFFKLDKIPESVTVIGGGPTGVELALALRLIGAAVTIVDAAGTILGAEDREMVRHVNEYLNGKGIVIYTGHGPTGLRNAGGKSRLVIVGPSGERTIDSETVLLAVGQEACVEDLALEKAGVDYDSHSIKVGKNLKTTAPNIYACGDVTGCLHLVGMAEHEGLIAANNALLPLKQSVNFKDFVWTVFIEPPLAHVGMTEEEIKAEYGFGYTVYRQDYQNFGRAQLEQEKTGFAKFICDSNGKLLGAHIFGRGAEAAAHELQLLKALGKPLSRLHSIKHAFPTYSEALVKRAGDIAYLEKMAASPLVRLALKLLPGFHNKLEDVKEVL